MKVMFGIFWSWSNWNYWKSLNRPGPTCQSMLKCQPHASTRVHRITVCMTLSPPKPPSHVCRASSLTLSSQHRGKASLAFLLLVKQPSAPAIASALHHHATLLCVPSPSHRAKHRCGRPRAPCPLYAVPPHRATAFIRIWIRFRFETKTLSKPCKIIAFHFLKITLYQDLI
jgi:hypothetical protein